MVLKCKSCHKPFKDTDDIIITDTNWNEPVHDECHYNYLANMHLNHYVILKELEEELKDDEE